jgi:hypothetical protein
MKRYSKDELRKEKQRLIEKKRKLDLEIARKNLQTDEGQGLHWETDEALEEKRRELEAKIDELQTKLGNNDLA